MLDKNLYSLIYNSKGNDKQSIETLLVMFDKLLLKYAYLLKYEDAKQDLVLHFIKTIKSIKLNDSMKSDPILISYINKSVKNEYIRLSKLNAKYTYSEINLDIIEDTTNLDVDFLPDLFSKYLTEKESNVLTLLFINDYKVSEVSKLMNISRQAVNQCKNRSLTKLKENLNDYF